MAYRASTLGDLRRLRILGVMTGTSCDGLDAVCVEFEGGARSLTWKALWDDSVAFPTALRARVIAAQSPRAKLPLVQWLSLNRDLGEWMGKSVAAISRKHSPKPDLIANHGQTIGHYPDEQVTLQLGDPSIIARASGITVATSFREGDLAAGGQGAPLAPLFHGVVARAACGTGRACSIHNIGGISNLSYFKSPEAEPLAFDTGPGVAWIDAAAMSATRGRSKMDVDGHLALQGRPDEKAVAAILRHPYFKKPPPKSTGRDEFPFEMLTSATRAKGAHLVATATAVTVRSIVLAYENMVLRKGRPLHEIYFCGGGAKNPAILGGIQRQLRGVRISTLEAAGFDPQLIEAQAFALFGLMALLGAPVGGAWTGARGFAPPAHLIPGQNWAKLLSKLGR